MILAGVSGNDRASMQAWLTAIAGLRTVQPAPEVWLASDAHGAVFRGATVTVVAEPGAEAARIAELYMLRGAHGLARLPTPVAFALYDVAARRLVASNDVLSRMPLAYWSSRGETAVCTRILPLLRHPRAPRSLDTQYLAHVVTDFACAPPGTTPIEGIRRLVGGEGLILEVGEPRVARLDRLQPRALQDGSLREATFEFWECVGAAIDRASTLAPCLALSGGLDSAVVGAELCRHFPSVQALSLVARNFGDEHEAQGVAMFESAFPQTVVRRIDCSDADAFPQLGTLALRDDPPLVPLGLLPGRLRLWTSARDERTPDIFDGEGGDEIFSLFLSPLHALRRGDVRSAFNAVRGYNGSRRHLLVRSLVLPHLPPSIRRRWTMRSALGDLPIPSYLRGDARSHPAIAEATEQVLASFVHADFRDAIEGWLSGPTALGALLAQRTMASEIGVRLHSPLLDRSVVELALGLAPRWLLADGVPKGFLREASRGRLPDALGVRPKNTTMAETLARRILSSVAARERLAAEPVRRRLDEWVRLDRVHGILDLIAHGSEASEAAPHLLSQMTALVSFADWYDRAHREYGVD
jgi:asparagine synthetase B (glutamine-hydrolysing)